MKTKNIGLCFSFAFLVVVVYGCAHSTESSVTLTPSIPTLPTRSATLVASATSVPIVSPTPSFIPTMMPTLPIDEARVTLLKMLSDNSICKLPCLWGIVPGKSSFKEAQAILVPLSSLSHTVRLKPSKHGEIIPRYSEGDLEIYTRVDFLTNPNNDIVNRITFDAEAHKPLKDGGYEDIFDSRFFGDKIAAYTLPHVLSEQGVPTSVMIATSGGSLTRGGTGGFEILLLYPDQGILANYTTQMHLVGTSVRGCPVNAYVEMELYPMGDSASFFELLKQTDWTIKLNYYRPIEEVTSMSVDEFYQTFRKPTNKCIETPTKFWPTPEP